MKNKFSKFINLQGKYLTSLLILLALSIGQMWGEDVTVDLALAKNTDPSPSIGAIIGTNYSKSNFDGTGYKIGSDNNSIGWDISASGKTFTAVTFNGYINTTNTSKNWGFKFSTDGGTTWGSELTQANDGTKSYHDISVTVAIPSGANAIQIIRKAGTSTYVSSITLTLAATTNYTVTIDPNGGSYASTPTGWTYSAGVYTKSVAGGSFTPPTGLTNSGQDLTWKDNHGTDITFPITLAKDSTFVAQWAAHTASSNADLSALSVAGGTLNETFDPATTAYTMTLPFYASMPAVGDVTATKDDANAADPVVSISGNVITIACKAEDNTPKTYTITVSFASTPAASSSINIEQLVLDNGKSYDIVSALTAANIVTDGRNGLDSLNDVGKTNRNYAYLGLKLKKTADIIKIVVPADNVLNVKFGNVGVALTTTINGAAGSTVAKKTDGYSSTFHLDAVAYVREIVFHSPETQTVTLQQVKIGADIDPITLPWRVTYSVDGSKGSCAKASEVWTGTALTLPTVTPESGWNFDGWIDDEDNLVSSPYTPAKNVTLTAQFTADASGTDLDALTYTIGSGSPVAVGYSAGTFTYNVVLPYAAYPTITVEATPVSGASIVDDATKILTVSSFPGTATFTVTDGVDEQLYTVNFSRLPKDGVSIIKVATTGGTNKTVTGLYAGDGDVSLSSNTKMDKYKFIGFTLDGTTLQAGDQINVHTTTAANTGGSHIIFYDNMTDKNELYETGEIGGLGDNIFEVNAAMIGAATAYVYRSDADAAHQWNGYVDFIEVLRTMNPVLKAITIDGRDGEIDALDDTHFSVTIPYESDLAALTVVPTIVRNAAHATTPEAVISNEGAWILGDNTYRVMDKDGDYTDYTITLDRDVLKHTVSFNTHGGSSVASELVEHNGYLGAAPADPIKDDYIFQYWSLTEDGEAVNVTSVTIDQDTTFHAVWASDGAIKLIEAGAINHTNFITGATLSESPVEIETVNYDYALLGGTASSPSGQNQLNKFIAYNATTTQTKVMVNVYNTATSARQVVIKGVVEGSTTITDIATIDLDNGDNKHVKSAYYSFDNAANRTIYISVPSSVGSVDFLQVKVIESGTPLPMFGKIGYSINLNQGRLFGPSSTDLEFEGMTYNLGSNYNALNSTAAVFKKNTSYQVTVPAAVTMTLTTSAAKYYVADATDGTTNETAAEGAHEFDLTAGTWYINVAGSNLNVTNIAFSAPKCDQPTITAQPATKVDFAAGDMTTTVVAEVSDGGTLSYQWYNASDDSEILGATSATLTTDTEGTYYVIVTNSLADHQDNSTKSDNATLRHRSADDATLSALSYGGTAITLEDGVYVYDVYLPEGTTDVPALGATASMAAYGATAVPTDAAEFVSYEATSTVLVTAENGTSQQTYTVNFHVAHAVATLVDVTGDMTWDFSKANDGSAAESDLCNEEILSNVAGIVNNGDFKSDNIMATANKFSSGKLQASMIKFHSTVDGVIKVVFSNTGNKSDYRYLVVNGVQTDMGSKNGTALTYYGFVPAGDVVLTVTTANGGNMFNFTSVKFIAKADVDFARDAAHGDDWMAPGELGTICLEHGAVATGGDVFTLECKNTAGKIVFASVSHMEPGKPYLFQAKSNAMNFYYTDEAEADEPDNSGAMKGSFTNYTLNEVANVYYFAGHALWLVDADHLDVIAHRAYVKMDEVVVNEPAPMPGRRYITMNVNGEQTATAIDNLNASEEPVKLLIDGQLFILRGEKMFDATGRLVK